MNSTTKAEATANFRAAGIRDPRRAKSAEELQKRLQQRAKTIPNRKKQESKKACRTKVQY